MTQIRQIINNKSFKKISFYTKSSHENNNTYYRSYGVSNCAIPIFKINNGESIKENGKLRGTILIEEGIISGNMIVLGLKAQNNVTLLRTKTLANNILVDKVYREAGLARFTKIRFIQPNFIS